MTDLLWPAYDGPDDLAAIEAVPLADRGLPATTYHDESWLRRAADATTGLVRPEDVSV